MQPRRDRRRGAGAHGLALQTAVIAVTLLIVAGSVGWTLRQRSGDVAAATEVQAVGYLTEATCATTRLAGHPGRVVLGHVLDGQPTGPQFNTDLLGSNPASAHHCLWTHEGLYNTPYYPSLGASIPVAELRPNGHLRWPGGRPVTDRECRAFTDGRLADVVVGQAAWKACVARLAA